MSAHLAYNVWLIKDIYKPDLIATAGVHARNFNEIHLRSDSNRIEYHLDHPEYVKKWASAARVRSNIDTIKSVNEVAGLKLDVAPLEMIYQQRLENESARNGEAEIEMAAVEEETTGLDIVNKRSRKAEVSETGEAMKSIRQIQTENRAAIFGFACLTP